jgi:hypothetical protein
MLFADEQWERIELALYRAITGGRSMATEQRRAVVELQRAYGTPKEIAAAVGVAPGTVRAWLRGRPPSAHSRGLLTRAVRRLRLRLRREARLRLGNCTVGARDRYEGRFRVWSNCGGRIDGQRGASGFGWDHTANGRILDAYLAGDMRQAAEEFVQGIREPFYRAWTDPERRGFDHQDLAAYDAADERQGFDIESIRLETD